MVPVEDGTFTLEWPHPEIEPRWGNKPWLCFHKADIVRQMQNYEYQRWNTGGRAASFSNFPFRKEHLQYIIFTCLALPISEIRLDKDSLITLLETNKLHLNHCGWKM